MRLVCCSVLVLAALASVSAHDPITTKVSWDREIAPIFAARCVTCHSASGPAPMSLATYADARPWARAIREEVLARRMPKWPVVRGYGDFSNDPSLSAFEIALITAWVDGGAPQTIKGAAPAPVAPLATHRASIDPADAKQVTLPCRTQPMPAGRLVALQPRLPSGGNVRVTIEAPDSDVEPLLWIRGFDPRIAQPLQLRVPPEIAPGTQLRVETASEPCALVMMLQ
jgi:hypothetical protein